MTGGLALPLDHLTIDYSAEGIKNGDAVQPLKCGYDSTDVESSRFLCCFCRSLSSQKRRYRSYSNTCNPAVHCKRLSVR